jgi:uncharacterized membrane protein YphA (DoxX/SURF4 family)
MGESSLSQGWRPPFTPNLGDGVLHAVVLAALIFAHRARWVAAIRLRAAGGRLLFLGTATTFACWLAALFLAHRALWAAAIRALPAAEILARTPPFLAYVNRKLKGRH